jgi:hypothetical protein
VSIDLTGLPARVLRWSLVIIGLLTLLHLLTTDYLVHHVLHVSVNSDAQDVRDLFRLQKEQSLPTWFSVLLLFGCSVALLLISTCKQLPHGIKRSAWLSLGLVFMAMSIDEQIGAHELIGEYIHDYFHTDGFLFFAWVIPGLAFVSLAGAYYWQAFKQLPQLYVKLFFGGGAIYILGALFADMLEGWLFSGNGDQLGYDVGLSYVLQDPLEMLGAAIFLYALLHYAVEQLDWRQLTVGSGQAFVAEIHPETQKPSYVLLRTGNDS